MVRRVAVAVLTGIFAVSLASGASAARPSDPAQGCENLKSPALDSYCATT